MLTVAALLKLETCFAQFSLFALRDEYPCEVGLHVFFIYVPQAKSWGFLFDD